MQIQWEGKVGPAAVISLAHLAVVLVGGAIALARMQDGIDNSRQQVLELRSVVNTMQTASNMSAERTAKVETLVGVALNGIDRVEKKLDVRFGHP